MVFTKTEIKVLELFTSNILRSFTIREVSRLIKKDLKIVHTSIKRLKEKNFFIEDKNGLRVNYKKNIEELTYIENIRKEDFFKKHELIKIHINNFLKNCSNKFFVLIVFGSYAAGKEDKKSDIDLLTILPSEDERFEKELKAALSALTKLHINVISKDSFNEMLGKRDEMNIINEIFNNHIILYGSEQYYALLGERDVR